MERTQILKSDIYARLDSCLMCDYASVINFCIIIIIIIINDVMFDVTLTVTSTVLTAEMKILFLKPEEEKDKTHFADKEVNTTDIFALEQHVKRFFNIYFHTS